MTFQSLQNQFLIAMPQLHDQNFEHTVTLLCQHDENGCLGVVVNRPMVELSFEDITDQLGIERSARDVKISTPVFSGGPVHPELGMVLHDNRQSWDATMPISEDLALTTSIDIIEAISEGQGPEHCIFILGYAGWGSGQLEFEIQENAWLSAPADTHIIFHSAVEKRWKLAARKIGVDLNTIATFSGHA